ncbi:MAG: WYL domain-containing protein [Eubacteriales bacterium]|nr:WYL domain-containing protein [Eubacteriales bacterium]
MLTLRFLLDNTDEEHGVTVQEIIKYLEGEGLKAERKTVYRDFESFADIGYEVVSQRAGSTTKYHIIGRDFELPELKMLVDSVAASKFVTEKKTKELLKKLSRLTSRYNASLLSREVMVSGRVKTMNESIYYNIDNIHSAMSRKINISFKYFSWNQKKEQELRHGGKSYHVSPWALLWDDENYYLVAYDNEDEKIKHFRVDKMLKIGFVDEPRKGLKEFEKAKIDTYSKRLFSMYSGEEKRVSIKADNRFANILIDRFGRNIMIIPDGPDRFSVTLDVSVSEQFISWIFSLGEGIEITGPEDVLEKVRDMASRISRTYL